MLYRDHQGIFVHRTIEETIVQITIAKMVLQ